MTGRRSFGKAALLCALLAAGCDETSSTTLVLDVITGDLDDAVTDSIVALDLVIMADTLESGEEVTCDALAAGELDPDDEGARVLRRESIGGSGDVTLRIELAPGRIVAFARANDAECRLLAQGCLTQPLVEEFEAHTSLRLEAAEGDRRLCDEGISCVDGRCLPCTSDEECDDGDPCTIDQCDSGACGGIAALPDDDGDRFFDSRCGGDDPDDADPDVYPGAPRRCGRALDHDGDFVIDDLQGCGTCEGATGLTHIGVIDAPGVGLFVIGSEDTNGDHEVFVATPSAIEVYRVSNDGADELLGSTLYQGAEPFAPAVLGEYTLVVDFGSSGVWVYRTDDLRAGGADPVTELSGEDLDIGVVSAFFSTTRRAYLSLGASGGSLATVDLSHLPDIVPPTIVDNEWQDGNDVRIELPSSELEQGEWRHCDTLAYDPSPVETYDDCLMASTDVTCLANGGRWTDDGEDPATGMCECSTGWLYGILGQFASFAALDGDGSVQLGQSAGIDHGFGTDMDLLPNWVVLAQGDEGILLVNRLDMVAGQRPYTRASQPLPVHCLDTECENATGVALAGTDRAVVMTFANVGDQKTQLYLVEITDTGSAAPPVLRVIPPPHDPADPDDGINLSHNEATGRDIVVRGNRVYVAARILEQQQGVVDIFQLDCP